MTPTTTIKVFVDFSESFTDPNGSFPCGTTEEQKDNAVKVWQGGDLTLYLADVHTRDSSEFIVNGGAFPAHHLIKRDQYALDQLGVEVGKTVSPQLTAKLYDLVKDKRSGLIVPRHVFFQDYNGEKNPQPAFTFAEVEETFAVQRLNSQEFLDGGIEYVVNAKHMFNGTALQATNWMGDFAGVPVQEMNIFSLMKEKYGQGKDLQFDVDGVVMGICIYQSASGIRQLFPKAKVNVIADACTHLVYAPLGIEDETMGNDVAKRMCQQIGINYLTMKEYLGK